MTAKARQIQLTCQVIIAAAVSGLLSPAAQAQQANAGKSFVENFDGLNRSFWYVSDGWNNGKHQNCNWSKKQVKVEGGNLQLGFAQDKTGAQDKASDRDFACGEIQTNARFGYGTYEVRMKSASGSGLNSAFFTYIGPTDKKPHDEIDFEVLGKNTGQVQVNQYVSAKGNNEKLVPVAGGADQGFNDYAFIWEENRLRYFVNGKLVQEVTDKAKIPQNPQKIFLSLWGTDTLKQWMGAFSYTQPTSMTVDRVAFTALGEPCRFPESVLCTLG
ncbi:Endo-1,3-1,4-beta-glycanase ExoK [Neorhizobium galegae bv. officinalis bv. officinalis str. HAMBI 1141]|uniref:Beta-glucanase n=1 Tax=Neorhizobium galegae bv. officinalis bv. officinalis str. HAMBI 1141 TaxID=1028801 RepID=A0A068TCA5_NEOGA|nr:glycoside hydrolase family 16 protein [Neorhizobium galegae]CDN55686.1 Endo-1,3-1,4-beta-glycanase ExoK [Neorhizobium galegae bv. officinalis bv. officinalis str. HAMBI 1141]